jgi:hypothetical protein
MDAKNKLYFGDNVMASSVAPIGTCPDEGRDRRLLPKEEPAVIDRRYSGWQSEAVYREIVERGPRKLADLMQALLAFLLARSYGRSRSAAHHRESVYW